jgi:diguanylate cyclase (GGDEF)-like protein
MSTHLPRPWQPDGRTACPDGFRAGLRAGAVLSVSLLVPVLLGIARRWRTLRHALAVAVHEASHDRLTGLPNRASAEEILQTMPVAMVGLLDLDHFKDVNDRYGHHIGDQLLIQIAHALDEAITGHGLAARWAGDEFLLLWTRRPRKPLEHATALLQAALTPLRFEGHHLSPAASLGLALAGPHLYGLSLVAAADLAMYETKRTGQVHLYPGEHPPSPVDRRTTGSRAAPSPRPHNPHPAGPNGPHHREEPHR